MASIWLRPEGRQEQRLQELINRLAEEHGTVKFAPHLTVSGIPDDLAVLDAAADYVRHCGLLPLRVAKSTVTGAVMAPAAGRPGRSGSRPSAAHRHVVQGKGAASDKS